MKEFFGFGGYTRPAEGFLSWQHLLFVGLLLTTMAVLAVWLGKKNRFAPPEKQNKVMIAAAFLIDGLEIFKLIVLCLRVGNAEPLLYNLRQRISVHLMCFIVTNISQYLIGILNHRWTFIRSYR